VIVPLLAGAAKTLARWKTQPVRLASAGFVCRRRQTTPHNLST